MSKVWAVYVRRSQKREGDADVSDEMQEDISRRRVPAGAEVVVFKDSGGHHSGFSEERVEYQRMLDWLNGGRLAGIVAYDDSRLNRNAENALILRGNVPLCAAYQRNWNEHRAHSLPYYHR